MAELSWSEPWIANAYINNSDWNRLCTYTLLQLRRHIIHINSYIELVSIFYVMFVVFVLSHQFCCKTLFTYELANCYELCITGERNKSSSLVEFVEWSQIYSSTPWYISYQLVSLLYLSYSAVYMSRDRSWSQRGAISQHLWAHMTEQHQGLNSILLQISSFVFVAASVRLALPI